MYLRSDALTGADPSDSRMMGIKTKLQVHATASAAEADFGGAKALTAGAIRRDLLGVDGDASAGRSPRVQVLEVEPLQVELPGATSASAFQISYVVQPLVLYEQRHRFRVDRVVVDLAITGRALDDGSEPAAFAAEALRVAVKQARRIEAALAP